MESLSIFQGYFLIKKFFVQKIIFELNIQKQNPDRYFVIARVSDKIIFYEFVCFSRFMNLQIHLEKLKIWKTIKHFVKTNTDLQMLVFCDNSIHRYLVLILPDEIIFFMSLSVFHEKNSKFGKKSKFCQNQHRLTFEHGYFKSYNLCFFSFF